MFLDKEYRKNWLTLATTIAFLALSFWWITIEVRGLHDTIENNYFTVIYPWMSLFGGIVGLVYARRWGGWKSVLGRSLTCFSIGLLLQFVGQAIYAFYIYILGVPVPYPSLGDIGYFGSIIFYIWGIALLAKVAGTRVNSKTTHGTIFSVVIPGIMLILTYLFFLQGYEFDFNNKLKIFLDLGYPLGQAIYVSIAILTLILSRNVLGGIMRSTVIFLIIALVVQYFSDFMFLYQASRGTWYVGGTNDFLYFVSYTLMTLALIKVGAMFTNVKQS